MTVLEDSTLPLIAFDQGELKDLLAKGGKIVDKVTLKINVMSIPLLADWSARKNVDNTILLQYLLLFLYRFVSITNEIIPLQSGSVFYEQAKLTSTLYKHRVIFTKDGRITL